MRFAQRPITRLVLAVLLVVGPVAGTALAKRGVHAAGSCSSPELSGPASATVGDTYHIDGCGFAPSTWVPLQLAEADGCCSAVNAYTDADGRFSYDGSVYGSGAYTVSASTWQQNRWRVAATWSFQAAS